MSLFGGEFKEASIALQIMAGGQLVNVLTGSVGFLLIMTGNGRSILRATLVMILVNVFLCALLIPDFGATGAALAAAISLVTANLLKVYYVRQKLGFFALPLLPHRAEAL